MNERGQPPNAGAGRGFDRVLAALGLALLVAAMIWLALLVRESGGGASSALQVSAETLVPEHAGSESVLEDEAFGVVLPGRARAVCPCGTIDSATRRPSGRNDIAASERSRGESAT